MAQNMRNNAAKMFYADMLDTIVRGNFGKKFLQKTFSQKQPKHLNTKDYNRPAFVRPILFTNAIHFAGPIVNDASRALVPVQKTQMGNKNCSESDSAAHENHLYCGHLKLY